MIPMKRTAGLLFLTFAVAFMSACTSSTRTERSAGEYVDDAVLTSKVKTKLIGDQQLQAFQVNVESFRGTVMLSGFVDDKQQIERAIELAKSVPGVQKVINNMVVRGPGGTAAGAPEKGGATRGGSE